MYNHKYHKFHSLYNHKFGFHINGPSNDAFDEVFRLKPKVVKTLDFSVAVMKRIRQEIPDVFLMGRLYVQPQDFGQLSGRTSQAARQKGIEMAERILREEVNRDRHHLNGRPIFDAWESLNEVFPEWMDEDTQKLYDEYQVAFGEKMRAAGFEPVAFNFGQGNGRGQQWLKLYPGTLEFYKYLGFHEYDWPTMDRLHNIGLNGPVEPHNLLPGIGEGRGNDGMWRCLRYRRIMNEGIRQKYSDQHTVIITECGMTQGVWEGPSKDLGPWARELTVPANIPGGVVSTPIPAEDYWQSLRWYNSELMKDDDNKREKERKDALEDSLAGATLTVDGRLAGLTDDGLLNDAALEIPRTADDGDAWPVDVGFRFYASTDDAPDRRALVTHSFATRQSSEGEDVERLLIVTTRTEDSRAASTNPQLLDEHQTWAADRAEKIADAVGLEGNYKTALVTAARLHDNGKRAARWQRAFNARHDGVYAKTTGPLVIARLGDYRHEFGSLPYAENDTGLQKLPKCLRDLVLHLIASHHGRARPVIGTEGCEAPPSVLEGRAREVALRFARLQKQWGPWGLSWWEALLRAADQQASRENDNRSGSHG